MTNPGRIRILLIEDHTLVRQGTRSIIERDPSIEVIGEADSAQEALRLTDALSPDVVLLDIRLRSGSGIEVARALHRAGSPTRVLVLTAYDFEQYVTALTRAGVSGYLLKDVSSEELVRAIHQVHEGQGVLAGNVAATVLHSLAQRGRTADEGPEILSLREIEVLELIMQGHQTEAISHKLGISPRTVESHVANILGKLGATSRGEAVQIAIQRRYLKPAGA